MKRDFACWSNKNKCPICEHVLYKKYEGMVCKNFRCPLYFKLEIGWVYLDGKKERSMDFFGFKYQFDISRHENLKRWLILKSEIIWEKKVCEICSGKEFLHIHHILPRCKYPELTFDKENLMLLCKECHKKIHEEDKYKFG
jgi:hypothetical protein